MSLTKLVATAAFFSLALAGCSDGGVTAIGMADDDDDDDAVPVIEGSCNDPEMFEDFTAYAESKLSQNDVPGGAIAIVCNGKLAFAAGIGVTKRGGTQGVDEHTRFQLASVTKGFTAAAAASLAQDGMLDLSAPVSMHVPSPVWGGIPVDLFLDHTSGFSGWFENDAMTLEGSVTQAANQPLWALPGEVFDYSNAGYSIAGQVVVEAAGKPFADVIEERVFGPANMTRATMRVPDVLDDDNHAWGTEGTQAIAPNDGYYAGDWYGPMGGAWSSVTDLGKWAEAHFSETGTGAISKSTFELLRTPRTPTMWASEYGLGLEIIESEPRIVMHGGSTLGFQSDWLTIPEDGFAVIALINVNNLDTNAAVYYPQDLTWEAVSRYYPQLYFPPLPDARPSASCVGTYQSITLGSIAITEDAGYLYASFDGGAPAEMYQSFGDSYYVSHPQWGEIDLAFWPPGSGTAEYVVGRYGVGKRE